MLRRASGAGRTAPRLRRGVLALLLAVAGVAAYWTAAAPAPAAASSPACRPAKVMTWNLYLGADLRPALTPQTQADLLRAATRVYFEVGATDFPRRAKTIADDVKVAAPDLIGLQEAELWRTEFPSNPTTQATRVRYDFLQILLRELAARGLHYAPVASVENADFEVPTLLGLDLRLTDRDVILARTDLPGVLAVSNPTGENFLNNLVLDLLGNPIVIKRGWTSVDVQLQGCTFRLVNTHLDGDHPGVQLLQAQEVLAGPAATTLPLVLEGDFNSRADGSGTPTYGMLTGNPPLGAGLVDAWTQAQGAVPGYTCCHDATALLRNPFDALSERIDLVLTRGGVQAVDSRRFGVSIAEWLRRGIWPSDHAGVAGALQMP
jgi:endonuclease/exonuclease/phosphatase family metal-dependent hydrolase